jgi:predicted small secreted protein
METTMKRFIAALIGASFFLAACNTMEGAGRDVEKTGNKIKTEAQEHK